MEFTATKDYQAVVRREPRFSGFPHDDFTSPGVGGS